MPHISRPLFKAYFSLTDAVLFQLGRRTEGLLTRGSGLSPSGANALAKIRQAKQTHVKKHMIPLSAVNQPCTRCRGKCCRESFAFYNSEIDYWLSNQSSVSSDEDFCSKDIGKPISTLSSPADFLKKPCHFLGSNGCLLQPHHRPGRCIAFICDEMLECMNGITTWRVAYRVAILLSHYLQAAYVMAREKNRKVPA